MPKHWIYATPVIPLAARTALSVMEPMSFTELSTEERDTLLDIAGQSIRYGLSHNSPLPVTVEDYSERLQLPGASFVTLNIDHQLRGCIGTLEAYQPLVKDVADHAFAAAFRDPRFPALSADEEPRLDIHISILTPAEAMSFSSEAELIAQLQPGVDGLILEDGYNKGTFLPSVWDSLPDATQFLQHLKQKAGLPSNHWSDSLKVSRYRAISIP